MLVVAVKVVVAVATWLVAVIGVAVVVAVAVGVVKVVEGVVM